MYWFQPSFGAAVAGRFGDPVLLKISVKLYSNSIVFKDNGYLAILLTVSDHIMARIKVNYDYATVFCKNSQIPG